MTKNTTYDGATSFDWSDPANWSNGLPVNGDSVTTPTLLASFDGGDGANPDSSATTDAAGDLLGTTSGGTNGDGTVFIVGRAASGYAARPLTVVTFDGGNGQNPVAGLFVGSAGNLYGTTIQGGPNSDGEVFQVTKLASGYSSTATPIVAFNGLDGAGPQSVLAIVGAPEMPVCLDVLQGGRRVARVLANHYRADLRAAGFGSHAFEVRIAARLPGPVEIRGAADGAALSLTEAALAA